MILAIVDSYLASPRTGVIGKLISIANDEYCIQVNNQIFYLNKSQFLKLIKVPTLIRDLLNKSDSQLIENNQQVIDIFLDNARDLYFDGKIEYEVLKIWREKLGFKDSNDICLKYHESSLEYGGLYLGGDWRDDYDARY